MKKVFIILAVTASILAVVLSVLPVSNLAIFPAILALIFGIIAFYLSKKVGSVKKIIQFSLLLTIIALSISIYKAVFSTAELGETETLTKKETESKEEAIEELEELDLEELEVEDIDI